MSETSDNASLLLLKCALYATPMYVYAPCIYSMLYLYATCVCYTYATPTPLCTSCEIFNHTSYQTHYILIGARSSGNIMEVHTNNCLTHIYIHITRKYNALRIYTVRVCTPWSPVRCYVCVGASVVDIECVESVLCWRVWCVSK